MDVQEGDTVYKVLQRTGLDVDAMGSKDGIYVKGLMIYMKRYYRY